MTRELAKGALFMKFKRSTLFSILFFPLMLTSCGGNTPTTTPSNPGSGSTTEKPTPDGMKKSFN